MEIKTKAQRDESRDAYICKVRELASRGLTRKEIAEQVGISYGYVVEIALRHGFDIVNERKKHPLDNEIRRRREANESYGAIAAALGITKEKVRSACKRIGLCGHMAGSHYGYDVANDSSVRDVIDRCGFDYVRGYDGQDSHVTVRCRECGCEFDRTWNLFTHVLNGDIHRVRCPACRQRELDAKREERRQKVEDRRRAFELEMVRARWNKPREQISFGVCNVCGSLFLPHGIRSKYCSNECGKKAWNATREHRRRKLINSVMVDNDITIEGLIQRDGPVCYLCGEACDMNDYEMRDDVFIAGNYYPSVDHVIPISRGGKHAWYNVKLAHRICNTMKSDK